MKRSPLTRSTPLARRGPLRRGETSQGPGPAHARGRLTPSAPRRDWTEANAKAEREGVCRVAASRGACEAVRDGCAGPLQRAHISGRAHDEAHPTRAGWLIVRGVDVVPLCRRHHERYDAGRIDLLPYLTAAEQARAVELLGGIVAAYRRLAGVRIPLHPPGEPEESR